MANNDRDQPRDESRLGQRSGEERQQPWTGFDPHETQGPGERPLDRQPRSEDGVRMSSGAEGERPPESADEAPARDGRVRRASGLTDPQGGVDTTEAKAGEPGSPDEAGEASLQSPSNPSLVREDVLNTSTSSGLHPDDEAAGQTIREQHRRGLTEISRMD